VEGSVLLGILSLKNKNFEFSARDSKIKGKVNHCKIISFFFLHKAEKYSLELLSKMSPAGLDKSTK
jgi:hypothetical protein